MTSCATMTIRARRTAALRAQDACLIRSPTAVRPSARTKSADSTDAAAFAVNAKSLNHASNPECASVNASLTARVRVAVPMDAAASAAPVPWERSAVPMAPAVWVANPTAEVRSVGPTDAAVCAVTVRRVHPAISRMSVSKTGVSRTAPEKSAGTTGAEDSVGHALPESPVASGRAKRDAPRHAMGNNAAQTAVEAHAVRDVRREKPAITLACASI
jgi:hypothetical protein